MKINTLPFAKVVHDSTKKFTKIKKQDYLEYGKYPIVDQGKDFICGYTDNKELVNFEDIPVIVFGDHTKIFKYIDFPIAIGADGVKVLTVDSSKYDTKYMYYYLKSLHLTDGGYSRHFKYLKAKKINFPEDKDDQIKIANLLTQVESLIAKREESIKLLDELLRSTFLDMFGDPVLNSKGWETKLLEDIVTEDCSITYGIVQPGEEFANGVPIVRPVDLSNDPLKIEYLKCIDPEISKKFNRTLLNGDELLLTVRGTVGDIGLATKELKGVNVTRGITPLRFATNIDKTFYYYQLKSKPMQNKIQTYVKGAALRQINLKDLRKLKLITPSESDTSIVANFSKKANKIESLKLSYEDSLNELHQLFGSLSQRAFKGELDLSGVEIDTLDEHIYNEMQSRNAVLIDDKKFATSLGQKFGFVDKESIQIIQECLGFGGFIDTIEDEVKILIAIVKNHSRPNSLIDSLVYLIREKEQEILVRQEAAILLSQYPLLDDGVIKQVLEIINNKDNVEQEFRLILAEAFIDKSTIYPDIKKAIYSILREEATSPMSNKEPFVHFLEDEIMNSKSSLAFDTLIKVIVGDNQSTTAYKILFFNLMNRKYETNGEMIDSYDYNKLKQDITSLASQGQLVQKFNIETEEIYLYWNFQ